jgi:hypothetical protein
VSIVELQRLGGATRLQRGLKFQPIALALDEANLKTARGVERGVERRAQVGTIRVRTVITSKPSMYEPSTKRLTENFTASAGNRAEPEVARKSTARSATSSDG